MANTKQPATRKPKPKGRPTKLDQKVLEGIEEILSMGQTSVHMACDYVGISPSTFYLWVEKGEAGEQPYVEFSDMVKRARAEAQAYNLAVIRRAAREGVWQAAAWWLERSAPDQWGRRERIEHVGGDGGAVRIKLSLGGENPEEGD